MWKTDRMLVEIARYSSQYREEKLKPMGLKSCHASYLMEICAQPGISQDTLAQRICISKSSVARQVAVLEADGFLSRIPLPADKRVMQLYPTEKALALYPDIQQVLCSWEDWLTAQLEETEMARLAALLQQLKERAKLWTEAL